jgi:hypothetical protein
MTKKILFASVLCLLSTILTFAQERGENRISLVVEPVISWMKSDFSEAKSKGALPGYNFGIKIDHFFGDNYAFATGLTINTTGGKIAYPQTNKDGTTGSIPQTYRLKHIEIPLGLRLLSGDLHRINIYGKFGLSPQINIKASNGKSENISKEIRLFDLGYHLGAGIEYSLGRRNSLMIGIIFNNGFVDITKRDNYDDKTILNRLTLELGFIF